MHFNGRIISLYGCNLLKGKDGQLIAMDADYYPVEYFKEFIKEPKIEETTEGPLYVVFISKSEPHIKLLFLRFLRFINSSKNDISLDKEILRKIANTVRIL
ncbi:MAG: hypothetical protein AB1348_04815 [Nitrospirota bacterium]